MKDKSMGASAPQLDEALTRRAQRRDPAALVFRDAVGVWALHRYGQEPIKLGSTVQQARQNLTDVQAARRARDPEENSC